MMRELGWLGVEVAAVWMGSVAGAEVRYLDYSRSVSANGTVWPAVSQSQSQNDARVSHDGGVFDERAEILVHVAETIPQPGSAAGGIGNSVSAYAHASQRSSFNSAGIVEDGTLDFYTSESYLGNGAAGARSTLSIRFALDEAHETLVYFLGGVPGEKAQLLNETTSELLDLAAIRGWQGVLDAGTYTLLHDVSTPDVYQGSSRPIDFGTRVEFAAVAAAPVPEPGVVGALVGAAVIGLRRRR